jgi:hypothetical protein
MRACVRTVDCGNVHKKWKTSNDLRPRQTTEHLPTPSTDNIYRWMLIVLAFVLCFVYSSPFYTDMCLHMYEYVRSLCPGLIWPTLIKATVLRKMLPFSLLYWEQVKLLLGGMLLRLSVYLVSFFSESKHEQDRLYGTCIVTLWRVCLIIMPPPPRLSQQPDFLSV